MGINKEGISFPYHGDQLLWIWWWKREGQAKYFSSLFDQHFLDLKDYWQFVGAWNAACRKEKIEGFHDYEIFTTWAKYSFLRQPAVVILRNINVEMKTTKFWQSVGGYARRQLLKDIAVLYFGNVKEATEVLYSVPSEFAEAYLFSKGILVNSNNENIIKQNGEENRGDDPGPY